MNPTPLNLHVLQNSSFLRLDESRTCLVSPSGTALRKWDSFPARPVTAGKLPLVRKFVLAGVTVSCSSGWATLTTGNAAPWIIDSARFAGSPRLTIATGKSVTEITITLSEARFPGLDLPADFTARLFVENGAALMEVQFDFCGFSARVDLVDWLTGATPAVAPVFFDDSLCRVTDGVHLRAAGPALAAFNPSWLFMFWSDQQFVELTPQGEAVSSKALALALLAPGMPSALPFPANRRAALFIPEKEAFDLPLWPERTGGWRFVRLAPPFHWLTIEADERLDGSVRRAVVAGGAPTDGLFFQPGADLLNDFMVPFSLPLQAPVYMALYDGDGVRTGAALFAKRTPLPLTLHTERCSLALGPTPRKPGFLLLDIPAIGAPYLGPPPDGGGKLSPGLPFTLLATAPRLNEVVVDPMPPLATSFMFLAITPLNRALAETEGEIAVADDDLAARILLPDWLLTQIVRPRDLMVLGVQFLGLRPEFHGTGPGRLTKVAADVPRIVVYFPPQSIGEQAFVEDTTTTDDSVPPTIINYRSAGLSRLVFDVREGVDEIPYTFDSLMAWHGGNLRPRLDHRAVTPPPTGRPVLAVQGKIKARLSHGWLVLEESTPAVSLVKAPPALDSTAIEAPYRLLLSPDQHGYWDTAVSAVMAANPRADLWHARLMTDSSPPLVRAIWSVDDTPGIGADPFPNSAPETVSLTKDNRKFIVSNCEQKAVDANQMMLTSLGAWLNLHGDWLQLPDTQPLEKWLHRSTLGRDQFVQVVMRGYLFPFGHKAVLIQITERKFGQNPPGRVGAWLRKRQFIVVKEYERNYADDQAGHGVFASKGRELPFRSVRLLTRVTPLLDGLTDPKTHPDSAAIALVTVADPDAAFWPQVGGSDYGFHLNATDKDGRVVEFLAPLAFVRSDISYHPYDVARVSDSQLATDSRHRYDFNGQKILFADPHGETDEALEAKSISFTGLFRSRTSSETWARPFYPKMDTAEVVVPALRQFGNAGGANAIRFFDGYLADGFGGANSQGQIFARFVDGVTFSYSDANRTDKVGGMIAPAMQAAGLSRAHGLVGAKGDSSGFNAQLAQFAGGTFNPGDFFGGSDAKILGGIDLFSILEKITGFTDGQQIPRWINKLSGGTQTRTFSWKTDKLQADAGSFASGSSRGLEITCNVPVGGASGGAATVSATLTDFTITLADVIEIPFDQFSMIMEAGRKPEVNVQMGKVRFCGALSFVSEIEDKLHLDRFVDPPSIDVTAEGLSISYGVQLPSIQVGVFALQNLALNASATLPFVGDPFRARFALSERQNPFLISVSLFAGGGFFAIGVGLDGVEMLELSLEFGGNLSLDIGVASGGIHIMAGIYIKIAQSASELTGYVRAGGSLSVLGLVSVSVELYLGLTYEISRHKAWGEASLTLEIGILFFSIDVTVTVRREFAGDAADPTLADTFTADEWEQDYLAAFAA